MQAKPEGERSGAPGRAEPRSGRRDDGDSRSLGAGTGHHAISMEIVRRRWSARADSPLSEAKCDALGSCCTSSHPVDRRWKVRANDNQSTKEMLDSCNSCQHITPFYTLIYGRAGSSFSHAGFLQLQRAGSQFRSVGHTTGLLLQSTGGL